MRRAASCGALPGDLCHMFGEVAAVAVAQTSSAMSVGMANAQQVRARCGGFAGESGEVFTR